MAETSACRRPAAARILTALAAAVCLLALFGGIGPRRAYAAEAGNIAFSVPAKVPFAVKADGTAVGPSAAAWRIENAGTRPLRMRDVAASGFDDGSAVSAVSEAMPVAGTSSRGIWSVSAGRGGASLTPSTDGTIEIPVGGGAGFTWSVDLAEGTKHAAGPAPAALGSVTFTLGNAEPVAFAVYSSDDQSLDFYKRLDVPEVGDTFEGKTVTAVYTGFETASYHLLGYDPTTNNWDSCDTTTPWFDVRNSVTRINVVDQGIKPYNLAFFFRRFENLESADLVNFDLSETVSINSMFILCKSLKNAKVPGISRRCTEFKDAFACCPSLTDLEFGNSDFSGGNSFYHMFNGDSSLLYDCTDWNVPSDAEHYGFNSAAPGVILPKPWQAGAFAVYSADDGSLDFYKRSNCELPVAGSTFEGKTATEVYTGIETDAYGLDGGGWYDAVTTPWYGRRGDILSVSVIDDGIAPKDLGYYFQNLENATSIDISKFSAPALRGLFHTFSGCTKLTDVALGPQSPQTLDSAFTNCKALSSVDLRPLDLGSVQVCCFLFAGCSSLKTIEGVADIGGNNPYRIEEAFLGCSSLESLDLSGWKTSYAAADNGHVVRLFEGCTNLRSVEIGASWTWNPNGYGLLPTQSFAGADGKWYSVSDGQGYAPADIPSAKADTYSAISPHQQAVDKALAKRPYQWTLDDQQAIAEDITAKGKASPAYAKAQTAMDWGTKWSMRLTDGSTLTYKIIGIDHDDLADGTGKAGLTFLTTSTHDLWFRMNATYTNSGGWEASELRQKMNSGEIWNLTPADFQSKVKSVRKLTNNVGGGYANKDAAVTATSDKLFLLSYSEIVETPYSGWSDYSWIGNEGTQYEAFRGKVTNNYSDNDCLKIGNSLWERSVHPKYSDKFLIVDYNGDPSFLDYAIVNYCVCPVWCF